MDVNKALAVVAKLHEERKMYHAKSVKAKRISLISVVIGGLFLIGFIVMAVLVSRDYNFKTGLVLLIVFGIFAFIFLELAVILYAMNKCVYARQEENRTKILTYLEKEVNGSKKE